jgi:hypothetical protein
MRLLEGMARANCSESGRSASAHTKSNTSIDAVCACCHRLFIEGCMEQRQFTPADGSKRILWELIVHACHLISDPRPRTAAMPPEKVATSNGPISDDWPVG